MLDETKRALIGAYLAENGLFLTIERILAAPYRRIKNRALERKLKTTGLSLGNQPKLFGLSHIRLGVNFSAGNGLWLEAVTFFAGVNYDPDLIIGNNVNFSDQVHVACTNAVHIGDGVLCGSHVVISDHSHGIYSGDQQSSPLTSPNHRPLSSDKSVTVGSNVWIGDGAAILAGSSIGQGSIIGAHAVVNSTLPDFCVAVGSPARVIRLWNPSTGVWEKSGS